MARGMIGAGMALRQDASVLKQSIKPGTTWRVLRFAGEYGGGLSLFAAVVMLDAVVGNINPLLYKRILDVAMPGHDVGLVIQLALTAALILLADAALGLFQSYLSARIGRDILLKLRTQLFNHIQRMPLAFFMRAQTGALVSRLNGDVSGAQSAFTDVLSSVFGNLVGVVVVVGFMLSLSWQITLAALLLLPLFLLPARRMGRTLQQMTRESYDLNAAVNGVMTERFGVAGALLAKLFGRPADEAALFQEKALAVGVLSVKRAVYGRVFFTALMLMAGLAVVMTFGWGGIKVINGQMEVGTLVALVSYLQRLIGPITGLSNIQITVMTALVSFDRVFEVMDLEPAIAEKPDAKPLPPGPAEIRFDHVSFRYPSPAEVSLASLEAVAKPPSRLPEKTVLADIDFSARPGSLTALVGPSGAGKSTITQLLARLYDVGSGAITINGVDLRDATMASIAARIGMVTQDSHLFHDTIRANLLYARPEAGEAEIWAALEAAQIAPLVRSLADGLDTLVGERGYRFSGGEKQRLAIARLLLKAPDIAVLDEATAHLDSESEAAIQRAFETARTGRTAIVIAHRLSTIRGADQILVLDQGRIVQRGSHEDLLAAGGLYADLHRRQFEMKEAVT
ncbi:MAG: ABC transporter ATP-binding protein [Alphaproteobacteria bacterium]|nr:ABC transporter ATP-binding protein [Alphaproteobacteria bacterium]